MDNHSLCSCDSAYVDVLGGRLSIIWVSHLPESHFKCRKTISDVDTVDSQLSLNHLRIELSIEKRRAECCVSTHCPLSVAVIHVT